MPFLLWSESWVREIASNRKGTFPIYISLARFVAEFYSAGFRFPLPAPKPKGQAPCLSLRFLCVQRLRKPAGNRQVAFPPFYRRMEVDELTPVSSGFRFPLPANLVLVPSVFVRVTVAKARRQPTSCLYASYCSGLRFLPPPLCELYIKSSQSRAKYPYFEH